MYYLLNVGKIALLSATCINMFYLRATDATYGALVVRPERRQHGARIFLFLNVFEIFICFLIAN